jgi:hypothetical protein
MTFNLDMGIEMSALLPHSIQRVAPFIPCGLVALWLCMFAGCQAAGISTSMSSVSTDRQKPMLNKPIIATEPPRVSPFESDLPLGIGAQVDIFISQASDSALNMYDVIQPYRRGRIFNQQPYAMEYSILPRKGELFNHSSQLSDVSIRSDYDFRIGMSRKFERFSDFFTFDFLMAKGRFSPTASNQQYTEPKKDITILEERSLTLPAPTADLPMLLDVSIDIFSADEHP